MAQPSDVAGRVIARECGEVDAGDDMKEPGGLPILLDRTTGLVRGCTSLGGREVNSR